MRRTIESNKAIEIFFGVEYNSKIWINPNLRIRKIEKCFLIAPSFS